MSSLDVPRASLARELARLLCCCEKLEELVPDLDLDRGDAARAAAKALDAALVGEVGAVVCHSLDLLVREALAAAIRTAGRPTPSPLHDLERWVVREGLLDALELCWQHTRERRGLSAVMRTATLAAPELESLVESLTRFLTLEQMPLSWEELTRLRSGKGDPAEDSQLLSQARAALAQRLNSYEPAPATPSPTSPSRARKVRSTTQASTP